MIKTAEVKTKPAWHRAPANCFRVPVCCWADHPVSCCCGRFAPNFATPRNLFNVLRAVAINGMIACAMTFVIISGDIDVSVGSARLPGRSSLLGVLAIKQHWPLIAAVAFVLVLGMLIHSCRRLDPGQVEHPGLRRDAGLMLSYKGLAKVITNAYPITPFPDSFCFWGQGYMLKMIPVPAVLMLITVAHLPVPEHADRVRPVGLQRGRQRGSLAACPASRSVAPAS